MLAGNIVLEMQHFRNTLWKAEGWYEVLQSLLIRKLGSYLYTYVSAHGLLGGRDVHACEHRGRLQFTHICADRWRAECTMDTEVPAAS